MPGGSSGDVGAVFRAAMGARRLLREAVAGGAGGAGAEALAMAEWRVLVGWLVPAAQVRRCHVSVSMR
jgi:hypothetical protein